MNAPGLTVHLVGNAHLDPVWLWRRGAGIDATIATCRTACDLLDAYPELRFTKGEAWAYAMLERHAPAVFERVAAHVAGGRWCLVGGWWVQPDCNFPLAESFRRQHELGQGYLSARFARRVTVGYNVDSFGHGAFLPSLLRGMGLEAYLFMRPGPGEMELPDGPFRWRAPDGATVTACRIPGGYATQTLDELRSHLELVLERTPTDRRHALCFFGVGDHGGGPTREQVEWIIAHRDYADDVRLVFSDPERYFAAVAAEGIPLPTVTGELQQHAIGCYSVGHAYRRLLRDAERRALMADALLGDEREGLWRRIAFGQFHDLAGACATASALAEAERELAAVIARCDEHLDEVLRREAAACPPQPRQRLVLHNFAAGTHPGPHHVEPWLGYPAVEDLAHAVVVFRDEAGAIVPSQAVAPEAAARLTRAFLLDLELPAGTARVLGVERRSTEEAQPRPEEKRRPVAGSVCGGGCRIELSPEGLGACGSDGGDAWLAAARLTTHADDGDTWSHGCDRYPVEVAEAFAADGPWTRVEDGPIRWRWVDRFAGAGARCLWSVACFAGARRIELRLDVDWVGVHRVLKLCLRPGFAVRSRRDGVPGGVLERAADGRELPVQGFVHLAGATGGLAVVSDDVHAADLQPDGTLRLTLLRCPYLAHHEPYDADAPGSDHAASDQGHHRYRLALVPGPFDPARLEHELTRYGEAVRMGETTLGMPPC